MAPLARTSTEAHLFMDLRPCDCGETASSWSSSVIELGDDLGSRYSGTCPSCGTEREFVFRLPDDIVLPVVGQVVYGDGAPSELLDPGEWLWVADRYAGAVPAQAAALDAEGRQEVRSRISAAIAAMDEVLAFVPAGADEVPAESFWSDLGRSVRDEEPGRFARDRLQVIRDTYQRILEEIDSSV
ncbi:hypothetical protein [Cryptosporangium phraense]|uniref:Uncharacterized protein n=1 Tax=Cryptosporangium phraense TaxID=2593070 RepID=A0A545AR81_9ACTN|nr:hypothetical protein [Cryptosporangium phraense]TQS43827.1 hypothetical protein FL583_17535 [Cryptosporangium phraense]